MDDAEIARLREINEKATQGEWTPRIHSPSLGGAHIRAEIHQCNIADIVEGTASSMDEVTREDCVANAAYIAAFDPPTTLALLDALEQARKERDAAQDRADAMDEHYKFQGQYVIEARVQRDAAQQDAKEARALLGELRAYAASVWFDESNATDDERDLMRRARIETVLEKKL